MSIYLWASPLRAESNQSSDGTHVGLKTAIKRILFQPGEQKREVIGGALRGLSFTFDLHVDTQRWRGQYERPLQHWLQKHVQ